MCLTLNLDREDDGRWIAEVPEIPGVLVYGTTQDDAIAKAKALSLRVLADRIEHGESAPETAELFSVTP
jgi:predicted RNase H-like HicB family nuclease